MNTKQIEGYGLENRIITARKGERVSQCVLCGALHHCHHDRANANEGDLLVQNLNKMFHQVFGEA